MGVPGRRRGRNNGVKWWQRAHKERTGHRIRTKIHLDDEMYAFICDLDPAAPVLHYLESGRNMVEAFADALAAVDRTLEGPLLEFACGHGRGTRHLIHQATPITVADIHPGAIDFVTAQCRVNGFVSVVDPAELVHVGRYRTIVVASLFSHLPLNRWPGWLDALLGLLEPDGRLVISTNGTVALDRLESTDHLTEMAPGFWYGPINETRGRLDSAEYGTTYVDDTYVRQSGRVLHHVPAGLWDTQDLYVLG